MGDIPLRNSRLQTVPDGKVMNLKSSSGDQPVRRSSMFVNSLKNSTAYRHSSLCDSSQLTGIDGYQWQTNPPSEGRYRTQEELRALDRLRFPSDIFGTSSTSLIGACDIRPPAKGLESGMLPSADLSDRLASMENFMQRSHERVLERLTSLEAVLSNDALGKPNHTSAAGETANADASSQSSCTTSETDDCCSSEDESGPRTLRERRATLKHGSGPKRENEKQRPGSKPHIEQSEGNAMAGSLQRRSSVVAGVGSDCEREKSTTLATHGLQRRSSVASSDAATQPAALADATAGGESNKQRLGAGDARERRTSLVSLVSGPVADGTIESCGKEGVSQAHKGGKTTEVMQASPPALKLRSLDRAISRDMSMTKYNNATGKPMITARKSEHRPGANKKSFLMRHAAEIVRRRSSLRPIVPAEITAPDATVFAEMLHDQKREEKWVIAANSEFSTYRDGVIVFFVLYEIFVVPLIVSFESFQLPAAFGALEYLSFCAFCVDFLLNFLTTFYVGELEITDHVAIAKRYVYSKQIWVDAVSCVPLVEPVLISMNIPRSLRLIRLLRVWQLYKRVDVMSLSSMYRLLRLLIFVAYNIHWFACFWNCVFSERDEFAVFDLAEGLLPRYSFCVWCACSFLLGLGALSPMTMVETYVATALSIYGATLSATIFGSVAVLIAGLDAEETLFKRKLVETERRLRNLSLPDELRKRVISYYTVLWQLNHAGSANIDGFVAELSPSLQVDLRLCLFREMITKVRTWAVMAIAYRRQKIIYTRTSLSTKPSSGSVLPPPPWSELRLGTTN